MNTKKWVYSQDLADIFKRVKSLDFEYKLVDQPGLLIPIPCEYPGKTRVTHNALEFTSLCPFNPRQPDMGAFIIQFIPDKWEVELKSLKYYLTSFRMVKIFHETTAPKLLEELWEMLDPFQMEILGKFNIRGGISTDSYAIRQREGWNPSEHNPYKIIKK